MESDSESFPNVRRQQHNNNNIILIADRTQVYTYIYLGAAVGNVAPQGAREVSPVVHLVLIIISRGPERSIPP